MNAKRAAARCANLRSDIRRLEQIQDTPYNFPKQRAAKIVRKRELAEHYCKLADDLARTEHLERLAAARALEQYGPSAGPGIDVAGLVETGAGLVSDVTGAVTGAGLQAPPSGIPSATTVAPRPKQPPVQTSPAVRLATGAAVVAGVGVLGWAGYRYATRKEAR